MIICYDDKLQQWYSNSEQTIYFGKNKLPIRKQVLTSAQAFQMSLKENMVGPLIGIFTSKEHREDFYGNKEHFQRIQEALKELGGISFVFTVEGIKEEEIHGFVFYKNEWHQAVFPLPDLIYNRIASYVAEFKQGYKKVRKLALNWGIPFYNPHFFDKSQTYCHLKINRELTKHLPETKDLTSKHSLETLLSKHHSVFVKPVLSNRGNGIMLLEFESNHYTIKTNKTKYNTTNIDDVWIQLQNQLKNRKAIIQQKIVLKKYQDRLYDLRVLVQRLKDEWLVTGVGVRLAAQHAITTHIPQGGEILPFYTVENEIILKRIEELAKTTAIQLEKAYGYLLEFSMDIGIDIENQLWIFEVNSKPMKFDEPQIQKHSMETLIRAFYLDAHFPIDVI